jgi:hypothetical protein
VALGARGGLLAALLICPAVTADAQSAIADRDRELPEWLQSWSALRPAADFPRDLPRAGTATAFRFGAPRIGSFWTAGNPAALVRELTDGRTDFTAGWALEEGAYRRPLDPAKARILGVQGSSWRPVSPRFAVLGRVGFEQNRFDPGTRANVVAPFGSSPFVNTDTSTTGVRRTRVELEGVGSGRLGDWNLGATLGYEARDHNTILSGVVRRTRSATPGGVAGASRRLGGVHLGGYVGYRHRAETIRLIEISQQAQVFDLIGFGEPPAISLQPDYHRRTEADDFRLGLSLSSPLGAGLFTLFVERISTRERQWRQETNEPIQDAWDADGINLGGAVQRPLGGRWLVTARARYTTLEGDADRGTDSVGVIFQADESRLDIDAELRLTPAPASWTAVLAAGVMRENRVRTDLLLELRSKVTATTPRVGLEVGRFLRERLFLAAGGSVAAYGATTSIPDPSARGPVYQFYYAPEFGLYATDARPVSGSVFARYRVAKAAALWFDWRIERLAPSGDSRVPLAPTGSRTVNRLTLGATFMALD